MIVRTHNVSLFFLSEIGQKESEQVNLIATFNIYQDLIF